MIPDKQKLTDEEQQKANKWIKDHLKDSFSCPVCGHKDFHLQDTLGIITLFGGGATMLGTGYPTLVMVCKNCAYMMFFSAVMAGVSPAGEEDTSDVK